MNIIDYFNSPVCIRFALALVHFLWQGLAIAILGIITVNLFGKNSTRTRYGVYVISLLAMVLSLGATYALVDVSIPQVAERYQADTIPIDLEPSVTLPEADLPETTQPGNVSLTELSSDTKAVGDPEPTVSSKFHLSLDWQRYIPYLISLYLLGVVVMMGRLLLGLQGGQRLRKFSEPVENAAILASLGQQARALGLTFIPAIAFCKRVIVPTVVGVFKPTILLPFSFASGLSPQQVEMLLAHELAHIRRYDPLVNIAQRVIEALLFFHPAVWFISHKIRIERENCCDDMVLEIGVKATEYASSLVEIAQQTLWATSKQRLATEGVSVAGPPSRLSDRIRRLMGAPKSQQVRLKHTWVVPLMVFAVAIGMATLLPKAEAVNDSIMEGKGGPLSIHLLCVRPDAGDNIYDVRGNRVEYETIPSLSPQHWGSNRMAREFIFKLPETKEPILFDRFLRIHPAGEEGGLSSGQHTQTIFHNGKKLLLSSLTFDRTYRKSFLGFFTRDKKINEIDLFLRYYYGPRRESLFSFAGPFVLGKEVQADNQLPYKLTPKKNFQDYAAFHLSTKEPFKSNTPVVAYDFSGKRYLVDSSSGRSGSRGAEKDFVIQGVPLSDVAAIVFGEKPFEAVFKNIVVYYPDLPTRNHAEYLDVMAQRLGLTSLSAEELARYQFKNPQEAIEVIDIVHGYHARNAFEAIKYAKPKINLFELDKKTLEKIHTVAKKWADSTDLNIRAVGIRLGLLGGWPEFSDMAIGMLKTDYGDLSDQDYSQKQIRDSIRNVADALARDGKLQSHQLQPIKKVILETKDALVLQSLFRCLQRGMEAEVVEICRELALDDRPWIWWPALEIGVRKAPNRLRPYDNWPEELKLRLLLATGELEDEQFRAKAYAMLPSLLTAELARMNSSVWNGVRTSIMRNLEGKAATEVLVGFLREMQREQVRKSMLVDGSYKNSSIWKVCYIVRTLNVWYGVNIGDLGTNETSDSWKTEPRDVAQLQKLTAGAIEWYEQNKERKPVELSFTGQVVDTANKAIEGARVNFTKLENYKDEKGYGRQRTVEIGTESTDRSGKFTFKNLPEGEAVTYDLNVSAEGFVDRNKLAISRLPDGRYRWLQNNIIVMQHPAKVSGKVIGPNSKPLAGAVLKLFINNHYSGGPNEKSAETDAEGNFRFDNITSGHHLLSFAKYKMVKLPTHGQRREYGGRFAAIMFSVKEGEEIENVVLDISKSVCSMEVEIVDSSDQPVGNVSLSFEIETPHESKRAYVFLRIFHADQVNQQGLYKFEDLPQGKFLLRVYSRELGTAEPVEVNLIPGKTTHFKANFKDKILSKVKPDVQVEGGQTEPPVWITLLPRSPIRTLADYRHSQHIDSLASTEAESCQLEIRSATDNARIAKVRYENYPIRGRRWGCRLNKRQIRQIGSIEDGEYLVSLYVNGIRCSNIADLKIDSNFDPNGEPILQLIPLPLGAGQKLPRLGIRAVGPSPADPKLTYSAIAFPELIVDGIARRPKVMIWIGPDGPLQTGSQVAMIVALDGYEPSIEPRQKHTVKAIVGIYESAPVVIPTDDILSRQWDKASEKLPPIRPPKVVLEGNVIGSDGKPGVDYEVHLFGKNGERFSEFSDKDGEYSFFNIPSGKYNVACNPKGKGQPGLTIEQVIIDANEPSVLNLSLERKYNFAGRIYYEDGKPAVGMDVALTCEDVQSKAEFIDFTTTDANGRYELGGPFGNVSYIGINGGRSKGAMPELKADVTELNYIVKKNKWGKYVGSPVEQPKEKPAVQVEGGKKKPPVWLALLPRSPIRSAKELYLYFWGWGSPLVSDQTKIDSFELEIRSAKDNVRMARINCKSMITVHNSKGELLQWSMFRDNLRENMIRRIGPLEDGEYLIAIHVNGIRCSNVAKFTVDSSLDSSNEPTLQVVPLVPAPGEKLQYFGLRATGPTPQDSELTNMALHFPDIIVDGVPRKILARAWSGPVYPLKPGQQHEEILLLKYYKPEIDLSRKHTVKAIVGKYESAPVEIGFDHSLGLAWDEATTTIKSRPPQPPVLEGRVIGPDGKPGIGYRVRLYAGPRRNQCIEYSDKDGKYDFPNVPTGKYKLTCQPRGNSEPALTFEQFQIEANKTVVQELSLEGKYAFSGKVTYEDGSPAAGVKIVGRWEIGGGNVFRDLRVTDENGYYELTAPFELAEYICLSIFTPDGTPAQGSYEHIGVMGPRTDVDFVVKRREIHAAIWPKKFARMGGKHPDFQPVSVPEGWDYLRLLQALYEHLEIQCKARLPDSRATLKDEVIKLSFNTREYNIIRPGNAKRTGMRRNNDRGIGPEPDGLILTVHLSKTAGQFDRPYIIDRSPWTGFISQVYLPDIKLYLNVDIQYGTGINEKLLTDLCVPTNWLKTIFKSFNEKTLEQKA